MEGATGEVATRRAGRVWEGLEGRMRDGSWRHVGLRKEKREHGRGSPRAHSTQGPGLGAGSALPEVGSASPAEENEVHSVSSFSRCHQNQMSACMRSVCICRIPLYTGNILILIM